MASQFLNENKPEWILGIFQPFVWAKITKKLKMLYSIPYIIFESSDLQFYNRVEPMLLLSHTLF